VPESILASVRPMNAPAGAVMTFYIPISLFVVITAIVLYVLFFRPHPRVGRPVLTSSRAGQGSAPAGSAPAGSAPAEADRPAGGPADPADSERGTTSGTTDGTEAGS
jgi:hypothetical protein